MADLATNLSTAFTAVGADVKKLLAQDGNLSQLSTKQKASLVLAINELDAAIKGIDVKSVIDDGANDATHAWSAQKVANEILTKSQALKNELLGGAGEAFDTLQELATLINNNKDAIAALQQIAGNHVRFDQKQELSETQKKQARENIGAADVASVSAAQQKANEAHQKATTNASSIGTLTNLTTAAQNDLVSAVNEVKTQADKGVADAAAAKKVADTASASASAADKKGQQAIEAAATADGKAQKAQGDIDTFKAAVGNTETDFALAYTTARDGGAAA